MRMFPSPWSPQGPCGFDPILTFGDARLDSDGLGCVRLNFAARAGDKVAQVPRQRRNMVMTDIAQVSAARSPAERSFGSAQPDDSWSADLWAMWLGPAALALLVLGTIME